MRPLVVISTVDPAVYPPVLPIRAVRALQRVNAAQSRSYARSVFSDRALLARADTPVFR